MAWSRKSMSDPEEACSETEELLLSQHAVAKRGGGGQRAGAALGASLLLVAGAAAWYSSTATGAFQGSMDGLIAEDEDASCTEDGQNCWDTKCCQRPYSKCYKKHDHWAACNSTCDAYSKWNHDTHSWETQNESLWDCTELKPCKGVVPDGEDCRETRCCQKPGSKCFKKNDHWAACNQTCDGNSIWNHDAQKWEFNESQVWECTVLLPEGQDGGEGTGAGGGSEGTTGAGGEGTDAGSESTTGAGGEGADAADESSTGAGGEGADAGSESTTGVGSEGADAGDESTTGTGGEGADAGNESTTGAGGEGADAGSESSTGEGADAGDESTTGAVGEDADAGIESTPGAAD